MNKELLIQRLNKYKVVTKDNHWLWNSSIDGRGYSRISYLGENQYVHRLSAMLWLKDFSLNLKVLHKVNCHERSCWNPDHLYMGTDSDNMQDRLKNGTNPNANKTHCPKGHEYTPKNTYIHNGMRSCKQCWKK